MNDSALLRSLIEKENMSRSYQRRAQDVLQKNRMEPSADQCMLLQRAADLESEMASMTIGAEKERHVREMNRLDHECSVIKAKLERPSANRNTGKKVVNSSDKPSRDNDTEGKTQEEMEIDRAVRTWYKDAPKHSFEDVAGMEELKNKLQGCIADAQADNLRSFLQIPKLNSYFFVGPPGCGKTFICEAFAHELMNKEYKFMSILGSDIISKYAGTAEKSVTRLFDEAMKNAPCIVFIDEIDSLCKNRSLPNLPEYAANITTSFLTGYNKIHSADSEVIFMAATNYPNRVDAAMLDRAEIIRLPLPDREARKAAFMREFSYKVETGEGEERQVEFKPIIQLKKDLTFEIMAEKTWRFNYRDIERFASAVKKTLFHELIDFFKDEDLAIDALKSGEYMLSLKKFEEILEKFKSSPKEEILRDLMMWEKKVQSLADIAETNLNQLYDCELLGDLPAPVSEESSSVDADALENDVPGEPFCPIRSEVVPDAVTGVVDVEFAVNARKVSNPVAMVRGEEMLLTSTENGYAFSYHPDEDESDLKVYVKDDNGFIGSFTVSIKRSFGVNN